MAFINFLRLFKYIFLDFEREFYKIFFFLNNFLIRNIAPIINLRNGFLYKMLSLVYWGGDIFILLVFCLITGKTVISIY